MKIWISHTYSDKEFVNRLTKILIEQGHQIVTLDSSLTAGEYLLERISKSISEADTLLFVISKHYFKSSWMSTEFGLIVSEASTKQNKTFIPILIDKGLRLPSYLSQYYYIDFTNNKTFDENTAQVLRAIQKEDRVENNAQIHKSITEALKQREKFLIADKRNYELEKKKQYSLRLFSLMTVITTLLTSIFVILYFIKKENSLDNIFNSDGFDIVSFLIGTVSVIIPVTIWITLKKGKSDGRK